jgi:UDP-glucose 4-epimerase
MIELMLQAERALSMGLVDRAEQLYWQAIETDSRNGIAVVGLAKIAIERGDDVTALRFARKALELDPDNGAAQRIAKRLEDAVVERGLLAEAAAAADARIRSSLDRHRGLSDASKDSGEAGREAGRHLQSCERPMPRPPSPPPTQADLRRDHRRRVRRRRADRRRPRGGPDPRATRRRVAGRRPRAGPTRDAPARPAGRLQVERPPARRWRRCAVARRAAPRSGRGRLRAEAVTAPGRQSRRRSRQGCGPRGRQGLGRPLMRVLVTGGAGYVGSVTVEALVAAGHTTIVLDDSSTGHRGAVAAGARLVDADYTDEAARTRPRDGHSAARAMARARSEPARYYRQNVAARIALLEAARAAGVGRIAFSSTAAVYGIPEATPIEEDAPLRPINPYGETKRTFEGALGWYGRAYGLRSVILRYFNVAGATEANGEDHEPESHLIPNVLRAAEGRGPVTLFGDDYPTPDGTAVRDYIDVRDLASAHLLALAATARADLPATHICNLGSGAGFSVREVLDAAGAVVGTPIPVERGPRREGDPPILVASAAGPARRSAGRPPTEPGRDDQRPGRRRAHPDGYAGRAPPSMTPPATMPRDLPGSLDVRGGDRSSSAGQRP